MMTVYYRRVPELRTLSYSVMMRTPAISVPMTLFRAAHNDGSSLRISSGTANDIYKRDGSLSVTIEDGAGNAFVTVAPVFADAFRNGWYHLGVELDVSHRTVRIGRMVTKDKDTADARTVLCEVTSSSMLSGSTFPVLRSLAHMHEGMTVGANLKGGTPTDMYVGYMRQLALLTPHLSFEMGLFAAGVTAKGNTSLFEPRSLQKSRNWAAFLNHTGTTLTLPRGWDDYEADPVRRYSDTEVSHLPSTRVIGAQTPTTCGLCESCFTNTDATCAQPSCVSDTQCGTARCVLDVCHKEASSGVCDKEYGSPTFGTCICAEGYAGELCTSCTVGLGTAIFSSALQKEVLECDAANTTTTCLRTVPAYPSVRCSEEAPAFCSPYACGTHRGYETLTTFLCRTWCVHDTHCAPLHHCAGAVCKPDQILLDGGQRWADIDPWCFDGGVPKRCLEVAMPGGGVAYVKPWQPVPPPAPSLGLQCSSDEQC